MDRLQIRWIVAAIVVVALLVAVPTFVMALNDDGNGGQTGAGTPPPAGQVKKPAPIESVEIDQASGGEYIARVTYGLPSGCAQPGGYEVDRQGDRIIVQVSILLPADPNVVCTMIYGTASYDVPLGTGFASGQTYTVQVNDHSEVFTAN